MSHDDIVKTLAKRFKTKPRHVGVDLHLKGSAIEVAASDSDLYQSIGQLRASRKSKKYLAVPPSLVPKARKLTKRTGIGVISPKGRILKRSRKKQR